MAEKAQVVYYGPADKVVAKAGIRLVARDKFLVVVKFDGGSKVAVFSEQDEGPGPRAELRCAALLQSGRCSMREYRINGLEGRASCYAVLEELPEGVEVVIFRRTRSSRSLMILGFTGTRKGFNAAQRATLAGRPGR